MKNDITFRKPLQILNITIMWLIAGNFYMFDFIDGRFEIGGIFSEVRPSKTAHRFSNWIHFTKGYNNYYCIVPIVYPNWTTETVSAINFPKWFTDLIYFNFFK